MKNKLLSGILFILSGALFSVAGIMKLSNNYGSYVTGLSGVLRLVGGLVLIAVGIYYLMLNKKEKSNQ